MDGHEHPFVAESFVARGYEFTIKDFELYGHRTIFEMTGAAKWIEKHRVPRDGPLDFEATAAALGVPVEFDQDECKYYKAFGVTKGLDSDDPLAIKINPELTTEEHILTFGHELGHVFLGLVLNLRDDEESREVEDFCELFAFYFALPAREIPKQPQFANEKVLLELYDKYSVRIDDLILEFMQRGLLPPRIYVDTTMDWEDDPGVACRDVVCLPCKLDYGSCLGMPKPETALNFQNRAFGGHFRYCQNEQGSCERTHRENSKNFAEDQLPWEDVLEIRIGHPSQTYEDSDAS